MILKNSFITQISILSSVFLLTSCSSLKQEVHNKMQNLEDSIRGYRVQYHTIPAGAKILCDGKQRGVAPFFKYYDLTPEQNTDQVLEISNCEALWPSGARAAIQSVIPLDQFPSFVHVVIERPIDVPEYEIDEAFGVKTLAERQKQLEAVQAFTRSMLDLGVSIREANRSSKNANVARSVPSFNVPSSSVTSTGGIRWNWIQPAIQMPGVQQSAIQMTSTLPNFSAMGHSKSALIPVFAASSCVGSIVAGRCEGSIVSSDLPSYCSGTFVDGRCIGSVLMMGK